VPKSAVAKAGGSGSLPKRTNPAHGRTSISHFEAKRAARSEAATGAASSDVAMTSKNASGAIRAARSGAMIRPFGVRRSAGTAAPTSSVEISFESIRSRKSAASGPDTSTYPRSS